MSAAYIQMCYSLFLSWQRTLWTPTILLPREQSDLNFLSPRSKTGVYMRLEIPLEYFCHLYFQIAPFQRAVLFHLSRIVFKEPFFALFWSTEKSGHNIVFKYPFFWRKVYVIRSIWRKVFGADYCAFCHLEVIFGGYWLSPYSTFPYMKW